MTQKQLFPLLIFSPSAIEVLHEMLKSQIVRHESQINYNIEIKIKDIAYQVSTLTTSQPPSILAFYSSYCSDFLSYSPRKSE